jgi:hypothetical protein
LNGSPVLHRFSIFVIALGTLAPTAVARADKAPVIVVPSRPGIPTVINGRNANYAIVEGDWGLSRPGHMPQTVIGGSPLAPSRDYAPRGRYYPFYGSQPARGRHEIDPGPDRPLPEPAESFSRSWSSHGGPAPVNHVPESAPRSAQGPAGEPWRDPASRDHSYQYGASSDVVPPSISDPNAINPPIVVVPQIGRRRP